MMDNIKQLMKDGYLCNPQQACTLRRFTLDEGKARGAQVIEVVTAGGLQIDFLPDSGLDIGQVRYRGVNMSWISKNGCDAPSADNPFENEFLHYFRYVCDVLCYREGESPQGRSSDEFDLLDTEGLKVL